MAARGWGREKQGETTQWEQGRVVEPALKPPSQPLKRDNTCPFCSQVFPWLCSQEIYAKVAEAKQVSGRFFKLVAQGKRGETPRAGMQGYAGLV